GGVAALERTPRADAGARRTAPDLVAFVEHLALTRPRPSIATLRRLTAAEASRTGEKPPSYATVRSIVNALDPGMVTLALAGPASYEQRPATPAANGRGLQNRREATELRDGAIDRERTGSRHGDPRARGASLLPGPSRTRVPPPCRASQCLVAGRPHRARHPHQGPQRETLKALADHDHGRLLASDLWVHGLRGSPLGDEHRAGATPGDLAQERSGLVDVRHARRSLRRPRK